MDVFLGHKRNVEIFIARKWGSEKRWVFQNFVRFLFRNTLDSDDIRENLL